MYLARAEGLGGFEREVAVKLIHAHLRENQELTLSLLDEARIAAKIRHPNVVPVYDVGEDPAGIFLVMEYVEGDTLSGLQRTAHAAGRCIPVAIGMRILSDALAGLHGAHDQRDSSGVPLEIVHRDFSPQNILVGTDGVSRLTDFGIAKAAGRSGHTSPGSIKGKVAYMAPEQARGKSVDRRCDVWAAGVIAWELLAARPLHEGDDEVATLLDVVTKAPPDLRSVDASVPDALADAVASALVVDRERRCPSADELRRRLIEACGGHETLADNAAVASFMAKLGGGRALTPMPIDPVPTMYEILGPPLSDDAPLAPSASGLRDHETMTLPSLRLGAIDDGASPVRAGNRDRRKLVVTLLAAVATAGLVAVAARPHPLPLAAQRPPEEARGAPIVTALAGAAAIDGRTPVRCTPVIFRPLPHRPPSVRTRRWRTSGMGGRRRWPATPTTSDRASTFRYRRKRGSMVGSPHRRKTPTTAVVIAATALLMAAAARRAAAQGAPSDRQASEFFRAGEAAYGRGDFPAAARAFEEAHRRAPHAATLYNAGLAWELAGDAPRAADDYDAALKVGGLDLRQSADAGARLAALEKSLGRVAIVAPAGNAVTVAHVEREAIPVLVHVRPGKYDVTLFRPGGRTDVVPINATAGARTEVAFDADLAPLPATPAADLGAPAGIDRERGNAWAWVAAATGVAVGGAAIYLGIEALRARDSYDQSGHTDRSAYDRASNLRTWTNVLWIGAGVAAVASLTLFLTAPKRTKTALGPSLHWTSAAVTVAPTGLTLAVGFP